jgi:hypothetical protein
MTDLDPDDPDDDDKNRKAFWWEFCTACHVLTEWTTTFHKEPPNAAQPCDSCHYHYYPEGF